MTSDIKQARAHLDEVYDGVGSEKYLTRCASVATAHALLAMYDLLDERLPKLRPTVALGGVKMSQIHFVGPGEDAPASTETGAGATESDAGPSQAPVDPPARERPSAGGIDEALAKVLEAADERTATWLGMARAVREHVEAEMGKCYAKEDATARDRAERAEGRCETLDKIARNWQARAEKAEAERDEFRGFWKDALADVRKAREERDGWRAKHAALRADVDRLQREHKALPAMWDFVDALGHDAARTPQADPDTVTLRRDDVEALLSQWEDRGYHETDEGVGPLYSRVRAALGWGDSDEA